VILKSFVSSFVNGGTGRIVWRAHWWAAAGYSTSTHYTQFEALSAIAAKGET